MSGSVLHLTLTIKPPSNQEGTGRGLVVGVMRRCVDLALRFLTWDVLQGLRLVYELVLPNKGSYEGMGRSGHTRRCFSVTLG